MPDFLRSAPVVPPPLYTAEELLPLPSRPANAVLTERPPGAAPLLAERPPYGVASREEALGTEQLPLLQGLRSGIRGGDANSLMTLSMEAAARGDRESSAYYRMLAEDAAEKANLLSPAITDYRQVHGLGDAFDYATGAVGQGVGSTLPSLMGGAGLGALVTGAAMLHPATRALVMRGGLRSPATLGGLVGATVPGYQMERDEAVMNASQDPQIMATRTPQQILDTAAVKGAVNMLPETILPAMIAGRTAARIMQPFSKKTLGGVAGRVAGDFATEGGTEALQEKVGQMAQAHLNPARDTTNDTADIINAGLMGGLSGPAMGAHTHLMDTASAFMNRPGKAEGTASAPKNTMPELGEALSSGNLGESIDRLTTDNVPPEVARKGADAIGEHLKGLDGQRVEEVARHLGEALSRSDLAQDARQYGERLYEDLKDPAKRASAYSKAKEFVLEHLKGRQAAEKLAALGKTARRAADEFYAGWKDEGKAKKNLQEEADATDRALDKHYQSAFGDTDEGKLFAAMLRTVTRDPTRKPSITEHMVSETVRHLGEDATPTLAGAYEILQRDGADEKTLKAFGAYIKNVDEYAKTLGEEPDKLAAEYQMLMPSAQREKVQAALGKQALTTADFRRVAQKAIEVYTEGHGDAAIRQFFGPNADKALKLAQAAVATRPRNTSISEALEAAAPETGDAKEHVESQAKIADKVNTKAIYSFRDGRERDEKSSPYGLKNKETGQLIADPLYDTVADAERIKERLNPDGAFAAKHRSEAGRSPTLTPAVEYAERLGLDLRQLAAPYNTPDGRFSKTAQPPATDQEARRLLANKAVIEAKPMTSASPTEFDRTAVEKVTSGENAFARPTTPEDLERKDSRYHILENGQTKITDASPEEGVLWLRAANPDGTPATHNGQPKFLRLDVNRLRAEMIRRENAMRRQQPSNIDENRPHGREITVGERYLNAVMEGLVSILTTEGNGVHGESGVFMRGANGLQRVMLPAREQGLFTAAKETAPVQDQFPRSLKISGKFTVGSILKQIEAARERDLAQREPEAAREAAAVDRSEEREYLTDVYDPSKAAVERSEAEAESIRKEVAARTLSEPESNRFDEKKGPQQLAQQPASMERMLEDQKTLAPEDRKFGVERPLKKVTPLTDKERAAEAAAHEKARERKFNAQEELSPGDATQSLLFDAESFLSRGQLRQLEKAAGITKDVNGEKIIEGDLKAPSEVFSDAQLKKLGVTPPQWFKDRIAEYSRQASQDEISEKEREATKKEILKSRKAAEEYVHRTLGDQIKLVFEKTLGGHSGEWTPGDTINTIRISMGAGPGVLSTAFHESMHEFFSRLGKWGMANEQTALKRAADSTTIRGQLERLLAEHPKALASMRADAEERLAYAYQFWAAAKNGGPAFTVGPETKGIFQKIGRFFREAFGALSADEQAEALFQAFYDGKMANKDAAGEVIAKYAAAQNRGKTVANLIGTPTKIMMRHIMPGHDRMLRSKNEALVEIAKLFHNMPTTAGGGEVQGYLNARPQMTNIWLGKLGEVMQGYDKETMQLAADHLTGMKEGWPAYKPARDLMEKTYAFLSLDPKDNLLKYMQDATVPVNKRARYFPRVWNMNLITENQGEFEKMLLDNHKADLQALADYSYEKAVESWKAWGKEGPAPVKSEYTAENTAKNITLTLSVQSGVLDENIQQALERGKSALTEAEGRLGFTPYMTAINERKLDFLDMTKFGKFLHRDYMAIMGSYVEQAVRRAEYARRFGNQGELLRSMIQKAEDIEFKKLLGERDASKLEAKERDALRKQAQEEVASYNKEIMAMEGTLGHDLTPTARKWIGYAMVYQNARILPLALFSSFIDAQGVLVRGGTIGDAVNTFKVGVRELYTSFNEAWRPESTKESIEAARNDYWARFAEMMGTVDNAVLQDALNQAYTGMYMYGAAKKLNDKIFKWNGMEAWNRGMRIGATQAAVNFFKTQVTDPSQHTARWLEELGVRKEDLQLKEDGTLKATTQDGLTEEQATRLRAGLQKWVDSAILRPNSAQRPAWASDPHWALIFHLKQFTYSFHTTILRQVIKEAQHGNFGPALSLASYIPVMLASDILRGMIQTGGGEPPWKKDWGPGEYMSYATQRAGVLGIGQFVKDASEYGPWTLGGPTADQVINGITDPLDKTLVNAIPANPLMKNAVVSMQMD